MMPKNVSAALKAKAKAWSFEAKANTIDSKAKAIKIGLEAHRDQGLASRTTSVTFICTVCDEMMAMHAMWI